jgi:TM2 domain-containing membrane protein YozV
VKRLISALILCTFPFSSHASAGGYTPEGIRAFTRYLIERGEYYRAGVELRRLASYYPGHISPLAFHVTDDYLLFKGKQYTAVIGKRIIGPEYFLTASDLVFKCDAYFMRSDYAQSEAILKSWNFGIDPEFDAFMHKRKIFASLLTRKFDEAEILCRAGTADFGMCREMIERAQRGANREKSPAAAAVLGIVPGLGYVYAGQIGTGIVAFLFISLNVLVTYFAFRTHNDIMGYFTGVIGGFFYAGSIAGGYLASKRFNTELAESIRKSVTHEIKLEEDREKIFEKYGIGRYGSP